MKKKITTKQPVQSKKMLHPSMTKNSYIAKKISAKDAFNLTYLDDLPEIVRTKLGVTPLRGIVSHVFTELFNLSSTLSLDEMQVGLYRIFGLEKSRDWISSAAYQMRNKGMIKNVPGRAGVYMLVK